MSFMMCSICQLSLVQCIHVASCTSTTCYSLLLCCGVMCCLSVVGRFVQFADSGYEADPEIDRIEQQVSLFRAMYFAHLLNAI